MEEVTIGNFWKLSIVTTRNLCFLILSDPGTYNKQHEVQQIRNVHYLTLQFIFLFFPQ